MGFILKFPIHMPVCGKFPYEIITSDKKVLRGWLMNHDNIGMLYCQRSPQMPKTSLDVLDGLFYHRTIKLSRQSCRFVLFVLNLPINATKIIVTHLALVTFVLI